MRARQQGITAIGFVVLAAFIGIFVFAGLRLTPVYLESMKVRTVLNDIRVNLDGQGASAQNIRTAIGKRLNIEMIRDVKAKDFKIRKSETGYDVQLQYERRQPFIGNLYLLVVFDEEVEIRR